MKIAVTGGSGYLGSVLIPKLLKFANSVDCFDIRPPNSVLLRAVDPGKFRFQHMDVADKFALEKFKGSFDTIVHLAAVVGYPACNRTPDLAVRSNVLTTEAIMTTKSPKTQVLLSSTVSVYGDQPGGRVTESSPATPNSIYGKTKKRAEDLVMSEPNNIVFRFTGAFGASPQMRRDNLIHDFFFKALAGEPIAIFEKHFVRQFIHISDMTDALCFAIQNWDRLKGNVYNVGNPAIEMTKADLIECMKRFITFPYKYDNSAGFDAERRNYPVSFDKFCKLGFTPKVSLEAGIKEIIQYYRNAYTQHQPEKELPHAA